MCPHMALTFAIELITMAIESGTFCINSAFELLSALTQRAMSSTSSWVKGITPIEGRVSVPSKWPRYPLASTEVKKRREKIVKFSPLDFNVGTEDGRTSFRTAVVVILVRRIYAVRGGAHNL